MWRFQFILVGVAALFMVGCVLVLPASAEPLRYEDCTDPGTPKTLNVTGVDVRPSPTPLGQEAHVTIHARTDREIRGGRIGVVEYFPATAAVYDLCPATWPPCPIAAGDFVISISFGIQEPDGRIFNIRIHNEEGYGPCIGFIIPVLPMLKFTAY